MSVVPMHSAMMDRQNSRVRISACIASIEYTAGGGIDAVPAWKKAQFDQPVSFISMVKDRATRIMTSMGQSPWDNTKILGHGSLSVCLNG